MALDVRLLYALYLSALVSTCKAFYLGRSARCQGDRKYLGNVLDGFHLFSIAMKHEIF